MHLRAREPAVPSHHFNHRKVGNLCRGRVDVHVYVAVAVVRIVLFLPHVGAVDQRQVQVGVCAAHDHPVCDGIDVVLPLRDVVRVVVKHTRFAVVVAVRPRWATLQDSTLVALAAARVPRDRAHSELGVNDAAKRDDRRGGARERGHRDRGAVARDVQAGKAASRQRRRVPVAAGVWPRSGREIEGAGGVPRLQARCRVRGWKWCLGAPRQWRAQQANPRDPRHARTRTPQRGPSARRAASVHADLSYLCVYPPEAYPRPVRAATPALIASALTLNSKCSINPRGAHNRCPNPTQHAPARAGSRTSPVYGVAVRRRQRAPAGTVATTIAPARPAASTAAERARRPSGPSQRRIHASSAGGACARRSHPMRDVTMVAFVRPSASAASGSSIPRAHNGEGRGVGAGVARL